MCGMTLLLGWPTWVSATHNLLDYEMTEADELLTVVCSDLITGRFHSALSNSPEGRLVTICEHSEARKCGSL